VDMKCTTVVGVFDTRNRADQAVAELRATGHRAEVVGPVSQAADGDAVSPGTPAEATGSGVLTPHTLAKHKCDASKGDIDLARTLAGLAIPVRDAGYYECELAAGRFLVAVDCAEGKAVEARAIISRYCGYGRMPPHLR
jgi:hypothetical protein